MILKNFAKAFGIYNNSTGSKDRCVKQDGTNCAGGSFGNIGYSASNSGSSYYIIAKVGSGTTTPTKDDYKLETPLDTLTQVSNNPYLNGEGLFFGVSTLYRNDTANAITVNEVSLQWYGLTAQNQWQFLALTRSVLSTPVTIQPNEIYNFSIEIKI